MSWPIEVTVGVHGSKSGSLESVKEALEDEGVDAVEWLETNEHDVAYIGYEILLDVELYEDGSHKVVGVRERQ